MAACHLFLFIDMTQYIGRFAPSPSGRLHFGSLVAAVGSYLEARANEGKIYLRIEDLDFYRCKKEYTKDIIRELNDFGFIYDNAPYIQSEHTDVYLKAAQQLLLQHKAFYCNCSRQDLKTRECNCADKKLIPNADNNLSLRFRIPKHSPEFFTDKLSGNTYCKVNPTPLTLIRRDKVIAYNLACVVDDIRQGITEVVRGSDLIDITTTQMCLYNALGHNYISYLHLPLAMADNEYKLSKQNHSPAVLTLGSPSKMLIIALKFLNQDIAGLNENHSPKQILNTAIERFELNKIPKGSKVFSIEN